MTRKSTSSTASGADGETAVQTTVSDQSPPPAVAPEWPQSGGSYIRLADGSLAPAEQAEQTED